MNSTMIGNLIRLRYKLLWANTRTRNGRIAMFFVGYLLLAGLFLLLMTGGVGAGMIAVRSGRAELVARVVLASLFIQALVTSVILGFGLSAVFSDLELRRYPVNARERFLVRHLIGIIDPFWFLVLGLELGLVVGLYLLGAAGFFQAMVPVLLVFLANYMAARALAIVVGRMMQNKAGGAVLTAFVLVISLGAGAAGAVVQRNPWIQDGFVRVLRYTPAFGAAAAMTASGVSAASGYAVVFAWLAGLAAALVILERRPATPRRAESASCRGRARSRGSPPGSAWRMRPWWLTGCGSMSATAGSARFTCWRCRSSASSRSILGGAKPAPHSFRRPLEPSPWSASWGPPASR